FLFLVLVVLGFFILLVQSILVLGILFRVFLFVGEPGFVFLGFVFRLLLFLVLVGFLVFVLVLFVLLLGFIIVAGREGRGDVFTQRHRYEPAGVRVNPGIVQIAIDRGELTA